jgi:formylglycine-generating enzyme required for sulfatase activity
MVDIPAGRFVMGAPPDADAQQGKPQHEVTIRAFRLGKTPVTFAQYDRFARATGRPLPQDDGLGRGDRPVINVDRSDMLAYIDWLNRESSETGFRLPSEAEWEYAARAGTTTAFYWGDAPDPRFANTRTNEGPDRFELTSPVRSFPANPWGLHDMAGNVWEMTADCRFPDYVGAPADGSPRTAPGCESYIVRGGDYSSAQRGQRPTARAAAGEWFRSTSLGFRVAQDMPGR